MSRKKETMIEQDKSLIVGDQENGKGNNQQDAQQGSSVFRFFAAILQLEQYGGSKITNQILKLFFLLFLYVSYAILLAAAALVIMNGEDMKQKFIDYVNLQSSLELLIAFIVVGITTLITYEFFLKDTNLTPDSRKTLNFILDIMTMAFHTLFLVYVRGFVYQNNDHNLYIAFWLILIALCFFIIRCLLKWVYYYCGTGKGNNQLWIKPFKYDQAMMRKHYKLLKEMKDDLTSLYEKGAQINDLINEGKKQGQKGQSPS